MFDHNVFIKDKKKGIYQGFKKTFPIALIMYVIAAAFFLEPTVKFIITSQLVDENHAKMLLFFYATIFSFFSSLFISLLNAFAKETVFSSALLDYNHIIKAIFRMLAIALAGTPVAAIWVAYLVLGEPKIIEQLSSVSNQELQAMFGLCVVISAIFAVCITFIDHVLAEDAFGRKNKLM